jgi:hypothetical protein
VTPAAGKPPVTRPDFARVVIVELVILALLAVFSLRFARYLPSGPHHSPFKATAAAVGGVTALYFAVAMGIAVTRAWRSLRTGLPPGPRRPA